MSNDFKLFFEHLNKNAFSQMSPITIKTLFQNNNFSDYEYLISETYQQTKINIQNYLYGELKCVICGGIIDRASRRKKVCSDFCQNQQKSNFQTKNNSSHKMSTETKQKTNEKLSLTMTQKIMNGEFTPKSENYKSLGTIDFLYNGHLRKVRSLWELIYWLLYPNLQYETKRIPYYDSFKEKTRIYITDFYDPETNTIFEIKPKKYQFTLKDKGPATISQGYNYVVVDDDFFRNTKTPEMVSKINECVINKDKIKNRLKWLKKSQK